MILETMKDLIKASDSEDPSNPHSKAAIFSIITERQIFKSPKNAKDDVFRVPLVGGMQTFFEIAATKEIIDLGHDWTAVVHTPTLVKPLTQKFAPQDLITEGISPEVIADKERLQTLLDRTTTVPNFLSAGGKVIAAAEKLELTHEQQACWDSHQNADYGENLTPVKIDPLPEDMVGATYFRKGKHPGKTTFAFIRAQQSDKTGPLQWKFGIGNADEHANIAAERAKFEKILGHLTS